MGVRDLSKLLVRQDKLPEASRTGDWEVVQTRMNIKLPRDYKEFVDAYGAGLVADFIRVFSPFSDDEYVDLIQCSLSITEMFRDFKWGPKSDKIPYPYYPTAGGLLPWGNDENGNSIFWLTEGAPSKWATVVADVRGPRWQKFDCSMTVFLEEVLTRKKRCKLWPEDFPGRHDKFRFSPFE